MSKKPEITTREIVNVMLGRKMRTIDVINEIEAKFGACDRKMIRNRIANMRASKNVDIDFIEKKDHDARVKFWHLKSVSECYFRQSSITRNSGTRQQVEKEKKEREYPRPKFDAVEINVCRMARAVHHLWSTGIWIPPEVVEEKRKQRNLRSFARHIHKSKMKGGMSMGRGRAI
ncbi:hypothetical protein [Enterobacter kobei]|uniref:hypothetical protein n=1 Tax=Enterobacter kobei TaxID=208224 RepID=UPI0006823B3F|nr:hypothetical protein [Enterobacter kobei]